MSGYELRSINQQERRDEPALPQVELVSPGRGEFASGSQNARAGPGGPVDKYKLVFIILLIHGVGTLMPWNMFINAQDYFRNYKLEPSHNGTSGLPPVSRDRTDDELVQMRKNFLSVLSLAAQLPNALFNGLNLLVNLGSGNLKLRVNVTLVAEAAIFLLTIILAVVNSYEWPGAFYIVTMISVVLLNMASGIYQNCVFGIGAKFPGKYTNAILIGSNLSGTFTSCVNLLSIWLAPEPQTAAMYYFITALLVIVICLVSYNLMSLNPFFRHYDQADDSSGAASEVCQLDIEETVSTTQTNGQEQLSDIPETLRKTVDAMVPRPSNQTDSSSQNNACMTELGKKWSVFKKCWPQCLNVFFTFYFTLALFPAVMASIEESGNWFGPKYFAPVCCFLAFNLFALVGNLISGWTTWPGRQRVWMLVAVRVLFVPFFLFCKFNVASRKWPVLIQNDIVYTLGNMLMALSSGYLSSLCMMFASSGLSPDEAPKAGMLAAFFLVFGIFMGINSSFILTYIVEIG